MVFLIYEYKSIYSKKKKVDNIKRIPYTLILIIFFTSMYIGIEKLHDYMSVHYYLNQNPYYRAVKISGNINNISNNNNHSDTQEIRFNHNNRNYYVNIPSDIPTQLNNTIEVKVDERLVIDKLKLNNLNNNFSHKKSEVTINHHDKIYHTHLTNKGDIIND